MKNKKGIVFISIGLLLMAAALGLTAYNLIEEKNAGESSENAVIMMERQIYSAAEDSEIYENAAEEEIPDYVLNPEMDMPEINIDGTDYIGMLSIPAIGLELPVISEWSYPNLKIAPCRYSGSVYKNDMVIAGHNYNAHFRGIEELSEGDAVVLRDVDGNEFIYYVAAKEVLPPTAVEEMTSGEWDLTLFTCAVTGTYRIAVRCDLEEKYS